MKRLDFGVPVLRWPVFMVVGCGEGWSNSSAIGQEEGNWTRNAQQGSEFRSSTNIPKWHS